MNKKLIYVAIYMTKKMMLVSCEHTPFTAKKSKEKVDKWKYIFLLPDNTPKVLWGESGKYQGDATDLSVYDESKAKDYPIRWKEFNGEIKEQLLEAEETSQ